MAVTQYRKDKMMAIKIPTTQYIFPPRAETCMPRESARSYLDMGWKPQIKYNDSRTTIKYLPNGDIELWNRHAEKHRSYHAPSWLIEQLTEAAKILRLSAGKLHMLDGGLLDQKHKAIKDTIVIWDILVRDDEHLLGTTYGDRYNSLYLHGPPYWYTHATHAPVDLGIEITDNVILARQYEAMDWDNIWSMVDVINAPYTTPDDIKPVLEGVVLKDPKGKLQLGYKEKNNTTWMAKSRVMTGRHRF